MSAQTKSTLAHVLFDRTDGRARLRRFADCSDFAEAMTAVDCKRNRGLRAWRGWADLRDSASVRLSGGAASLDGLGVLTFLQTSLIFPNDLFLAS